MALAAEQMLCVLLMFALCGPVRCQSAPTVEELSPVRRAHSTVYYYLVHAPDTDWLSARQLCHDVIPDGDTALLDDHMTMSHVTTELSHVRSRVWLGGYKRDSHWSWLDGASSPEFGDEPLGSDDCAGLYIGRGYAIYTYSSKEYAGMYFCQYSTDQCARHTPSGCTVLYQDSAVCLTLCEVATGEASWYGARDMCLDTGGDLAVMGEPHVLDSVRQALERTQMSTNGIAWLGLRRNSWLWTGGKEMVYSQWLAGMPLSGHSDLCLNLNTATSNPGWESTLCDHALNYSLCQASQHTTSTVPSVRTASQRTTPTVPSVAHSNPSTDKPLLEDSTMVGVTTHKVSDEVIVLTKGTIMPPRRTEYWLTMRRFWVVAAISLGLLTFGVVVITIIILCKQNRVQPKHTNWSLRRRAEPTNIVICNSTLGNWPPEHLSHPSMTEKVGFETFPVISYINFPEKHLPDGDTDDLPPPYPMVCDYDLPGKDGEEKPQNEVNTLKEMIYSPE